MNSARTILEAETPKKAFKEITSLSQWLARLGFVLAGDTWMLSGPKLGMYVFRRHPDWELQVNVLVDGKWAQIERTHFGDDTAGIMHLLTAVKTYRGLYEAESPKRSFREITADKITPWLQAHRFTPQGTGWQRKTSPWADSDANVIAYTVWLDQGEWVIKKEGKKGRWGDWRDLGHVAFKKDDTARILAYLEKLPLP